MLILWKGMKVTIAFFLLIGFTLMSGVLTVLLYERITIGRGSVSLGTVPESTVAAKPQAETPNSSAMVDAPVIKQYPELPSGCEVTSLTMLLQYAGIQKTKLDLAGEMNKDNTPIRYGDKGAITFWGDPNTGFVGDVTGKAKGFGIYHTALLPLLKAYVPSAVDLTGKPFEQLEKQLTSGVPIVVWSTIDYAVPTQWVEWDSPHGPIKATFAEHAVLLVGYDEMNVYVNDPVSGKKAAAIGKAQFLATWEAMGKQALSYHK